MSGSGRFSVLQNSVRAEFCEVQISEFACRLEALLELLQFLLVRLRHHHRDVVFSVFLAKAKKTVKNKRAIVAY